MVVPIVWLILNILKKVSDKGQMSWAFEWQSSTEEQDDSLSQEASGADSRNGSFDGQYVSFKDIDAQNQINVSSDDLPKYYGTLLPSRSASMVSTNARCSVLVNPNKWEDKMAKLGGPKGKLS